MKPFQFRLATLLKLREATRDDRRARLAEAFQAAGVLEQRMEQLDEQRRQLRAQHALGTSPGSVAVERLLDVQRYEFVVAAEQQVIAKQQQQIEEEIEQRRQALRVADQDVRVLEKLKEKQQASHRRDLEKLEAKAFDEMASRQAALARQESVLEASAEEGGDR